PGERLTRTAVLGARGTLEAADGTVLAAGPQRTSADPTVSAAIVGSLGPIPTAQRTVYRAAGYPPDALVGQDGLELIFQRRLAGRPGGRLLAGHRVLAQRAPKPGVTVRTTIDPRLEVAALNALGGAYAGMTVLNIHTGAIEAAAGLAFTDLQPPGSTFKIITASAALQARIATLQTVFPQESQANIGGYVMQNAGGEVCGGALITAFAVSCDTTFAPLGIEIGARRLVSAAERFGFNQPTQIPSALESTIPSAATIGDATAVGSTAIGQGRLLASTLEMADAAAAIADGGRRPIPSFAPSAHPRTVAATTPAVAQEVQTMMEAVVTSGTGQSAAITGYHVAGKTGTAELASTANQQNNVKETDAWFVGYVPDSPADVVACALFPANGYGAASAAPAVRTVLETALAR
ncbi:MAG TPA: penicillin-binding transpeptidase domain-containing protein, partial [Solirubrobacteraceae bacterium]|nr:penicillin-binding transpeptidase domain-containing protein [Solirubrobacteraceae bacterium]